MKLAELQRLFTQQLSDPDSQVPDTLGSLLQNDRIQVYRGNFLGAQIRTLENIFPAIQTILGPAYFGQMLRHFVRRSPHYQRDLGAVGEGFPNWLEEALPEHPELRDLAYLPELAKLELAHEQARHAPDSPGFDFAAFQASLNTHGAEHIGLSPAASLHLLELRWPVDRLWQAQLHEDGADVDDEMPPLFLAVLREQQEILHLRLQPTAFQTLQQAAQGTSLAMLATIGGPNQIPDLLRLGAIQGFSVLANRQ